MAAVEKVSIALSPEMVAMLKGAVASGEYASASEVVREALREWNLRKPLREAEIERLRKAWREGVESGSSRPLDFQEIKRRGRERLAQAKQG
ncbi:type II toxin-antitoxin system ParD family antitoxin [Mesorhizobium koreense]|uniref:type II toxin-antitoxin system ParD family antitoxin n=1 Tax=Mesorhizobium koreense TaxID=3074855 RepID=UPI00287BBE87|nr:type II toxin-antitoxin system ParD family antitoxin [Mesorhizobium sp. WR6]